MLSGVNNQSPLSSALTLPSVSVAMTMNTSSSSSIASLGDNFFLGIQPLGMTDLADLHRHDQVSGTVGVMVKCQLLYVSAYCVLVFWFLQICFCPTGVFMLSFFRMKIKCSDFGKISSDLRLIKSTFHFIFISA